MLIDDDETVYLSQAVRQGLAVLIASTVAVLKHETLTIRIFSEY